MKVFNRNIRLVSFLPFLVLLLAAPLLLLFDTVYYMLVRPACLNCGSLGEFVKNASLTVHLFSTIGFAGLRDVTSLHKRS